MRIFESVMCLVPLLVSWSPALARPSTTVQVTRQERRQIVAVINKMARASRGQDAVWPDKFEERLLTIAQRNPKVRAEIIRVLLKRLNSPQEKDRIGRDGFWSSACRVLGRLKATEAVDLLVSMLGVSTGIASLTWSTRPAAHGLALIGEPSVSKIADALNEHGSCRSRYCRVDAIYALGYIDTPAAREVLTDLAKKDPDLRPRIEDYLRAR
jgi:hypothetical protein